MLCPHLSHIYSCLLSVIRAASVSLLITSAIWCHVFINWTSEFKNGNNTRVWSTLSERGCIMWRAVVNTHRSRTEDLWPILIIWCVNTTLYILHLTTSILLLTANIKKKKTTWEVSAVIQPENKENNFKQILLERKCINCTLRWTDDLIDALINSPLIGWRFDTVSVLNTLTIYCPLHVFFWWSNIIFLLCNQNKKLNWATTCLSVSCTQHERS